MFPTVADPKGDQDAAPALRVNIFQIHMRPRKKKMETILGSRAEVVNSANAPELILGACLENQGGLTKDSVYTK